MTEEGVLSALLKKVLGRFLNLRLQQLFGLTIARALGVSVRGVVPSRDLLRIGAVALVSCAAFLPKAYLNFASDPTRLNDRA